ncbi:hypothetical protein [Desulfurobacterium sp.]|uniref:hypothetical protein n=1 Tax=Desulfurobacterium sp. TaxID=2004706 RepID=UPI0026304C5A|nr:hypothetical protein [Desulfurobacterium sp.]
MIIKTRTPYLGKKKIWMRFVTSTGDYEKFYEIRFHNIEKGAFLYEIGDDFPKDLIELIFGYGATIWHR